MKVSVLSPVNWPGTGACVTADRSLFHAPEGEGDAARRMRELHARAVCARCPFTGPEGLCATWAIATGDQWSVAGGLNPVERTSVKRAGTLRSTLGIRLSAEGAARRAVIVAAGEKPCTGPCGATRPLSDFSREGKGWRGQCKACRRTGDRVRQEREAV